MIDVPILRAGQAYESKDTLNLVDYATGDDVARISMANAGLISRDLRADAWSDIQSIPMTRMLELLSDAARYFLTAELPVGGAGQTPDQFVAVQSATTGLPHALCQLNMTKIEAAMCNMGTILDSLTGGLDLSAVDEGYGDRGGRTVSYAPKAKRFGAVLPANSPGVHALWLPAIALKIPLALKPGQREPWTPLRILEACRMAGVPEPALGFYPCGHGGADVILRRCGAAMIFGAGPTVRPWLNDPRVEIHGPGDSKIVVGPDKADAWCEYLDLIVTSVGGNGGRSCVNASSIRTTGNGRALARSVAQRLAEIVPRSRHDPAATLAAFADPAIAEAIDGAIERELSNGGAEDISAQFRTGKRLVEFEGGTYLLPTVIYCEDAEHPLANREYLFPFVSVVDTPGEQLLGQLGPSLVVTALTEDAQLRQQFLARSDIGRLNLGPVATTVIQWDQPHEGNLFEHLYQQRAFQREPFATAAP